MSSYFRTVSKLRDSRALLKAIMDRINRLEQQVTRIETIDFRHFVRSNNDRLLYVGVYKTELGTVFQDPNLKDYQMPMEPDGDKLVMWFKFLQFSAANAIDSSGFNNEGQFLGSPETAAGPVSSLPAVLFDGNDRLVVPHKTELSTTPQAVGFSFSFNFNPLAISLDNGMPRILAAKTDDDFTVRNQGWVIWVEPTGSLFFSVLIAGIKFTASYPSAFPALNTWYRVVCTFDRPTVTPKIYVNGVVSPVTVTSNYSGAAELPSTSLDMTIGGYDTPGFIKGMCRGLFSDVRYWREKVLTQAENDNLVRNGYSISNMTNVARAGVGNFRAAILSIS